MYCGTPICQPRTASTRCPLIQSSSQCILPWPGPCPQFALLIRDLRTAGNKLLENMTIARYYVCRLTDPFRFTQLRFGLTCFEGERAWGWGLVIQGSPNYTSSNTTRSRTTKLYNYIYISSSSSALLHTLHVVIIPGG